MQQQGWRLKLTGLSKLISKLCAAARLTAHTNRSDQTDTEALLSMGSNILIYTITCTAHIAWEHWPDAREFITRAAGLLNTWIRLSCYYNWVYSTRQMYTHLFWNALVCVIYSVVSGQYSYTIHNKIKYTRSVRPHSIKRLLYSEHWRLTSTTCSYLVSNIV